MNRGSPLQQKLHSLDLLGEPLQPWSRPHCAFPLFAVPIKSVLAMERIRSHEELLQQGLLVEWSDGMGPLVFISQTWLGHAHPDPRGCKLGLLKAWLRSGELGRMTASEGHEGTFDGGAPCGEGYSWLDFWSIPQADCASQAKAIRSIPAYVARCSAFVCLAPSARHEDGSLRDLRAWQRRGWCRLERLSNALAPAPAPFLVVESETSAYLWETEDWIFSPVCEGDFADPRGWAEAAAIVKQLVDARQIEALLQGDLAAHLLLRALRGLLLAGADGSGRSRAQAARPWARRAEGRLLRRSRDLAPVRAPDAAALVGIPF